MSRLNRNPRPLARARRARGLSQEALAKRLSVSQTTLSSWEREAKTPRPKHAAEIARILGEDIDTLFPRYFPAV